MPNPKKPPPIVPIDQLVDILDEFGTGFLETEEGQAFGRLMNVFEAKCVELAPHETGNLEGSSVVRVEETGATLIGTLTFAAEYAAAAHELPDSARGEGTLAKPGNEYGLAGPDYVGRPLHGFTMELSKDIGAALQKYWTGTTKKGGKRKGRRGKK